MKVFLGGLSFCFLLFPVSCKVKFDLIKEACYYTAMVAFKSQLWVLPFIYPFSILLFLLLYFFIIDSFPLSLCQDSAQEWIEAQPQAQAAKPWQVSDESKPSESNISPAQNVQVTFILGSTDTG